MVRKEFSIPKERGLDLYLASHAGFRMVYERLIIESAGLDLIDLPFCEEEEATTIEELIPRAKEGFALATKASSMTAREMNDLYLASKPLTIEGIWQEIKLKEQHNTLPEWQHFIATLALLSSIGRVRFSDFSPLPKDMSRELITAESFWWTNDLTPGMVWTRLEMMENLAREALYAQETMGQQKLITLGHFFSAGKEVSKIFLGV